MVGVAGPRIVARLRRARGGNGSRTGRGSLRKESAIANAPATPEVDIDSIDIVDESKARKKFPNDEMEELAGTIEETGLVQPIKMKEKPDGRFDLVAGEQRFRAAKIAGLNKVEIALSAGNPVTESLVENIHRSNLNPIETAIGLSTLRQRQRLQVGGLEAMEAFHYAGPGDSPAWTQRGSTWTRSIVAEEVISMATGVLNDIDRATSCDAGEALATTASSWYGLRAVEGATKGVRLAAAKMSAGFGAIATVLGVADLLGFC